MVYNKGEMKKKLFSGFLKGRRIRLSYLLKNMRKAGSEKLFGVVTHERK